VKPGDVVLGLAIQRRAFQRLQPGAQVHRARRGSGHLPATLDGKPFKQALMEPTRLYVKNVLAALAQHPSRRWPTSPAAACWRTSRACCPRALAAHLQKGSWPQTELFAWLQKTAGIDDIEMNRTFNNGIGMVVVVDAANAEATAATLRAAGEQVEIQMAEPAISPARRSGPVTAAAQQPHQQPQSH
jgi:phosphoribosylformylglycinamidine cyclo-ligase